jgi:glycerol-3-phosphate dehydrogenase
MNRAQNLSAILSDPNFDVIIIGGGATGIGTAVEACLRGYRTLLLEKNDFTKGTSSRSTKLVHGGVRYLAQGDLGMVVEALRERGYLSKNAPHLVRNQSFIIPNYRWWEGMFYTIGLTLYDLLAGKLSMGRSRHLSRHKVMEMMPGVDSSGLWGGVLYHDGQFDDSRLAMDLLHVADENGGYALNYFGVDRLIKDEKGVVTGIAAIDKETGSEHKFHGKVIVNAAGVWVDDIMEMDQPGHQRSIRPSQGVHLVLDKTFMPGDHALMIPKTSDGRVLFAVPWHDHVVVGTTDTPLDITLDEPIAQEEEIDFILRTASNYFKRKVHRSNVLSIFAGLRPLAAPKKDDSKTKEISRNHKILVSNSQLITIIGGKWTTYRKMAVDILNSAIKNKLLSPSESKTKNFCLLKKPLSETGHLKLYGDNAAEIKKLIEKQADLAAMIHPSLPYSWAEITWICRNEMVYHLEDVLARRLRALFLNARASHEIAEDVAHRIASELGWDENRINEEVASFRELAKSYIL